MSIHKKREVSVIKATAAIAMLSMLLMSCGTGKHLASSASADKKYVRKAIVETTDERLKHEAMLIDAKMQQELGRDDRASTLLHELISADPQNDAAHYELSRIYASNGIIDSALFHIILSTQIDDQNVWYQLHLASLYRYTKQFDANVKTWEHIVATHPNTLEYYYELSNAYLQKNDIKGAITTLNRVEKMVGVTEAVSLQKAKLWNHLGKEDKALQEMEKLAKTIPQDNRYNTMLAEQYMTAGNYSKAKECYDRIAASDPDDPYIHISLAEYYKTTKQPRKAYEELKTALGKNGLSTTNKMQILTNFYSKEEFYGTQRQYCFDLLEKAMEGCDDSSTFAAFYGDVLMRQDKNKEALHWLELAIRADNTDPAVWDALLVSAIASNADSAIIRRHATRALALFPLHHMPYYALAVVEHTQEHYLEAIKLMKRCENLGFENGFLEPETYSLLAECYNRVNDTLCYSYYEKYLKLRPGDPDALNSYAYRLALDKHELKKAEAMSKKTLSIEPDNPYYLDTYAWILHQSGRDKEALSYIERAMQRDKESDEVRQHYEAILLNTKK